MPSLSPLWILRICVFWARDEWCGVTGCVMTWCGIKVATTERRSTRSHGFASNRDPSTGVLCAVRFGSYGQQTHHIKTIRITTPKRTMRQRYCIWSTDKGSRGQRLCPYIVHTEYHSNSRSLRLIIMIFTWIHTMIPQLISSFLSLCFPYIGRRIICILLAFSSDIAMCKDLVNN